MKSILIGRVNAMKALENSCSQWIWILLWRLRISAFVNSEIQEQSVNLTVPFETPTSFVFSSFSPAALFLPSFSMKGQSLDLIRVLPNCSLIVSISTEYPLSCEEQPWFRFYLGRHSRWVVFLCKSGWPHKQRQPQEQDSKSKLKQSTSSEKLLRTEIFCSWHS